jgi:GTP pyrophosphokinase
LQKTATPYVIDLEAEKREILKRYRNLLTLWKPKSEQDKKQFRKAFYFAVEAHKDMRRKSGEPYVFHPIEVARLCVEEIGLGTTSVIAALLHDVVEDTSYTLQDIEVMFGEKVARITDGLTKIKGFVDTQPVSMQAENFRKILITLSDDIRVILIKLADRLHNMRTLDSLPKEKQLKIASETQFLYAPLAHRLGLYAIKSELEDLAFKYTEPEIYLSISQKIQETEKERNRFISKFIYPIKKSMILQEINCRISARVKSVFSIWEKMQKKEIPFEEVFDVFAIRIIIDTPVDTEKIDCWRVYSILTDHYKPNLSRLRDWISIPKANGYEALHTTVMSHSGSWVEVQIRSDRMDEIAEKGYAAHWKYKEAGDNESGLDEWLKKAKEMLDNEDVNDALAFVDDFKLNLYSEEIYVYSPKGKFISLPAGSSALDFAYNIHTEIGNNSIGAKVNHRLVPLNHKLKSGDQVEIITSAKQKPREDWLNFVVTAKARTIIREKVKEESRRLVTEGRQKFKQMTAEVNKDKAEFNLNQFIAFCGVTNKEELYIKVQAGTIGSDEIKAYFRSQEKDGLFDFLLRPFIRSKNTGVTGEDQKLISKIHENPGSLLLKDNINEINYDIAVCCQPIPGDDVIGLLSKNDKIEIHRTNCKAAILFMSKHGDQIVKAKWKPQEKIGFLCGIKINGIDKKGLVAETAAIISEQHNLNIRSFHMETNGEVFKGIVMIYVTNSQNLNELMSSLKKVKGIINVTRINELGEKNPMLT